MLRRGFLLKTKCLKFNLNSNKLYSISSLNLTNKNQIDMTEFWKN